MRIFTVGEEVNGVSILRTACAFFAGLWIAAASSVQAAEVNASGLVGARVVSPDGEPIGEIRDLAVLLGRGSVSYAILDSHDPTALKTTLSAVPLTAFRPGLARNQLVIDLGAQAEWRDHVAPPAADPRLLRASTILGMAVKQPEGAEYGVIHDVVIEFDTGSVRQAVIRLERGSWNETRKVPFSALRFPAGSSFALIEPGSSTGSTTDGGRKP